MLYANGMGPRERVNHARAEDRNRKKRSTIGAAAALLLGAMVLTGCDFEVSNPGPVADEFLNNAGAHQAIVNGAMREMNYAVNTSAMDIGNRMREVQANDANPWEGISYNGFLGIGSTDVPGYIDTWGPVQAARWITADAIRRFEDAGASNDVISQAHLWGGFALRLMGEYFCEVVFDGGPGVPGTEALIQAEERFTSALSAGGSDETTMAARAGRASVRVSLGDWVGAVQDAAAVPTDFQFVIDYHSNGHWRYYNAWVQGGNTLGTGAGAYTIWNTPYDQYYRDYADPRTPWVDTGAAETTSLTEWDIEEIPSYAQLKYTDLGDDIDLATGEEMRLIQAESLLRDGDMAGAMAMINDLRARVGVDAWPAPVDMEEAWTFFKREKGIELWMEGRRMADIRRWKADGTPGALDPIELGITPFGGPDLSNQALCMPIPQDETDQNPNFNTGG